MVKRISSDLQEHLDSRATTMCYCWKITRNDTRIQGFTDHDNDLVFDGVTYEAATGFTASQFASSLGLAVDNLEVTGAISSETINEIDLAKGYYDNAKVEIYWVNWQNISQRHIINRGFIGEVKRQGVMFSAELRGLSNVLQQKTGRKYQRYCDAVLGDARCGVNTSLNQYRGSAIVSAVSSNKTFITASLNQYDDDWFSAGLIRWIRGPNTGINMEIKFHKKLNGTSSITLWQSMPTAIVIGDIATVIVGCKQDIGTCKSKFNNVVNFRGFNLIPGPDMLVFYPRQGDDNLDGKSLFSNAS